MNNEPKYEVGHTFRTPGVLNKMKKITSIGNGHYYFNDDSHELISDFESPGHAIKIDSHFHTEEGGKKRSKKSRKSGKKSKRRSRKARRSRRRRSRK